MQRTAMWENIGIKATSNDFDSLMHESGLDYLVETRPIYTNTDDSKIGKMIIPGRLATVRTDTNDTLGIVTDRYKICQNVDALDFVKFIDGINLIKAGTYNQGAGCYLIGQLPEIEVLHDTISPHIIFQNSHDGSGSIKSTICMLRIICQNQFIRSFAESPATIRLPHTGNLEEKIAVAKDQMVHVYDHIQRYEDEANTLATKKVTPAVFNKILQHMFDINTENSDRKNKKLEEDREVFLQAYHADDNQNFINTKWGLINAYSDFITHAEPARKSNNWEEGRFIWYLNPAIMNSFVDYIKAV